MARARSTYQPMPSPATSRGARCARHDARMISVTVILYSRRSRHAAITPAREFRAFPLARCPSTSLRLRHHHGAPAFDKIYSRPFLPCSPSSGAIMRVSPRRATAADTTMAFRHSAAMAIIFALIFDCMSTTTAFPSHHRMLRSS